MIFTTVCFFTFCYIQEGRRIFYGSKKRYTGILHLKPDFQIMRIRFELNFPDGVTERYHGGKLSGNVPKRCRNVSRGSGVLFSCKNDRYRQSGRVDLGKFGEKFPKSDRREVVLGVPRPRKSDLSEKTPELAFLCPVLTILKF